MPSRQSLRCSAAAVLASIWLHCLAADITPLAPEDLFRSDEFAAASLAPGGQLVAGIASDKAGLHSLLMIDLNTGKPQGIRSNGADEIYAYAWVDDQRLVYNVATDKIYAEGLYAVTRDQLEHPVPLINSEVTSILRPSREHPGHVMVAIAPLTLPQATSGALFDIDATTTLMAERLAGGLQATVSRRYAPPEGMALRWILNGRGEPAFCITYLNHGSHLFGLDADRRTWTKIPVDLEKLEVLGPALEERTLWVVTHEGAEGFSVRRYFADSNTFEAPVWTDKKYDPAYGAPHLSPLTGELLGFTYPQERLRTVWLNKTFTAIQSAFDQRYATTDNELVSVDAAQKRFLFRCAGPQQPAVYVLLDTANKRIMPIGSAMPWLRGKTLAPATPIQFTARDGREMEGYLTLPQGAAHPRSVPLVVLVHGGPESRDLWTFSPTVQFLASRGYAVLQPNYRGSAGYAPANSANHRIELKACFTDVVDATRSVLATNAALNPQRTAIMGDSFGGYIALSAVAFNPETFCCAVSLCGISDWSSLLTKQRRQSARAEKQILDDYFGDPTSQQKQFDEMSPFQHVDQIHAPVLIAHGDDDKIVDVSQSRQMAAALERRHVPHETFFRPFVGHGFYNRDDEFAYYHAVENFLAKYLSSRASAH